DLELQKVILERAHVVFAEIRNKNDEGANSVENIIVSFSFNGFHRFHIPFKATCFFTMSIKNQKTGCH
nr:hypothetical protein [Tanacetum cinerariifolium]